jgi:diguanylate cyclase (GGDEF)-like protein
MPDDTTSVTTPIDLKPFDKILQPAARPALVILTGRLIGKKYDLLKDENVIGRSGDCEIAVEEEDISRNHARLTVLHGRVSVLDLGSTNGTYVNRKKAQGAVVLQNGDELRCGNTIFKFLSEGSVDSVYHDELYKQATLDPLTSVFNRKHFTNQLESEFLRARRYRRPLSLVLIDLDYFKRVNDTHGHPAGDFVLERTAELVRRSLRAQDVLARYGGEEFALLLPETPADNAYTLAEKLRAKIQATVYQFDGKNIEVTASMGVATLDAGHTGVNDLVVDADKKLYAAKHSGRNVVCR